MSLCLCTISFIFCFERAACCRYVCLFSSVVFCWPCFVQFENRNARVFFLFLYNNFILCVEFKRKQMLWFLDFGINVRFYSCSERKNRNFLCGNRVSILAFGANICFSPENRPHQQNGIYLMRSIFITFFRWLNIRNLLLSDKSEKKMNFFFVCRSSLGMVFDVSNCFHSFSLSRSFSIKQL